MGATCSEIYTREGTWYRVREGDTVGTIAKKFGVQKSSILQANRLSESRSLMVGERVYVPYPEKTYASTSKRGRPVPVTPTRSSRRVSPKPDYFDWPVDGKITSRYGYRNGRRHDGLDISAARGTAVKAAADGEVVFADRLRGYGNLILVKHEDNYFTAYAHNSRNLKKRGSVVKKGEIIARVGTTGRVSGPHLHFEIRMGSDAQDPLNFLPKQKSMVASAGAE